MENNQDQSLFSLSIDPITKSHLNDTARWARFLAITGIILLILGLVFTVLMFTVFADSGYTTYTFNGRQQESASAGLQATFIIAMLVGFAIAFFPLLFLLQFSNRMKKALNGNDQEALNVSFLNLKRYFRYVGVIMIICLAIYALIFILALLTRATA
jgi:hypothetical protein